MSADLTPMPVRERSMSSSSADNEVKILPQDLFSPDWSRPADEVVLPGSVDCDTLSMHRDRGILPGDFIKPDPALTRQECRKYLLAELERWLTGRICSHAKEIAGSYPDVADLTASVEAGKWPAARLYTVLHMLERSNTLVLPTDYEERFHFAAEWCIDICADRLKGNEPVIPEAIAAAGFVTTDKLPGGRVIASFWNHSPFDALREAAPLTEGEAEVEAEVEVEAEAEEEDADDEGAAEEEVEAEAEAEAPKGIDDMIDDIPLSVVKLLTSDYTVRLPGWAIATGFGVLAAYVWSVALALAIAKHC